MTINSKKNSIAAVVVLSLLFASCKKDPNNNSDSSNTPAVPVEITSYTPQKPMWGDEIEITGKGFPSTIADIEVWFPGNYNSMENVEKTKGQVVATTPTVVKVKIPYVTQTSATNGFVSPVPHHNGWGNIVIIAKGKDTFKSPDYFVFYRAVPFMNRNGIVPEGYSGIFVEPGRKFRISGQGFGLTKTEGELTINGTSVMIDSVWGNVEAFGEGNRNMIATLPASLGSKSTNNKDYTYTYTRFGRSISSTVPGKSLPRLILAGNTLKTTPYTTLDNVTDFTITGNHLFANEIRFSEGSFFTSVGVIGASLSATSVTAFVPLSVLLPRGNKTYNVILFDTVLNISYGTIGRITVSP